MKLLAWDTSSKAGAIVALEWQDPSKERFRLVSEWAINVDANHSDQLLWGIHQVLESARWKIDDIDVFGVGVGPGSFTGLRIGVTTARTLASTLSKPLIGVSSLAALARPAAMWLTERNQPCLIVATTDASKGELFSLYGLAGSVRDCAVLSDGDFPGLWKRGVEEEVLSPDDLMKVLKKKLVAKPEMKWLAIGEGRKRYAESWDELPKKQEMEPPVPFTDHVQGRYLGLLCWEAYQAGLTRNPMDVHPRYARASDAELKLKAGLLPKGPSRS